MDMRSKYKVGQRVEISPAYDSWAKGDRYGEIKKVTQKTAFVKLDKSGKTLRVNRPSGIYDIIE